MTHLISKLRQGAAVTAAAVLLAALMPLGGFASASADGETGDLVPFFLSYRYNYGSPEAAPASGSAAAPGYVPAENDFGNGIYELSPAQKGNVAEIYLELFLYGNNVFYELGRDFFTDYLDHDGNLFSDFDGIWYTLNGYTCPFYITELWVDSENRIIKTGVIPVLFNGRRAELIVHDEDYNPVVTGIHPYGSDAEIPPESLSQNDTLVLVTGYSTKDAEWTAEYRISPEIYPAQGLSLKYEYLPNPSNAVAFYMITDTDGVTHTTDALKCS